MNPWSCDTFVALADAVPSGQVLVGKNSDRPVSDAQPLRHHPRRRSGGRLALAYLEIDDVAETYAHLGGSPYWCWGHEFGLNEWGVVIGNEALFTRDWAAQVARARAGESPEHGLLGMELVRLGLERGRTADEALSVLCTLLERHGQWGSGVPGSPPVTGAYDNSFLVADPHGAWVLETSGRQWAARRLSEGSWAISNQPTIRTRWDRASAGLVRHAVRSGWWQAPEEDRPDGTGTEEHPKASGDSRPFDFALAYVDPGTPLQLSHIRLQRSRQLLGELRASGGVDVAGARRILRDHYEGTFLGGPYFNAALPDFLSLCMHSHPSDFTWGNTAASAIFVLPKEQDGLPMLWWSPVTPCTGVYLPVFAAAGEVPEALATAGPAGQGRQRPPRPDDVPQDTYDARSYWWRFRRLLDVVKGDPSGGTFAARQPVVRAAFDALERQWADELPRVERQALKLRREQGSAAMARSLADFTASCARQALALADELTGRFA